MRIKLFILSITFTIIFAGTRVYDIEPFRNCNAWSPYMGYIGQTFVATCDSFVWAEVFIGKPSRGGSYIFEILKYPENIPIYRGAESVPTQGWRYVRCRLTKREPTIKVEKGRTYLLKVTHSGGDSINFYYDLNNPYPYGEIKIGGGNWGQNQRVEMCDLAARIEGVNWVDSMGFGCQTKLLYSEISTHTLCDSVCKLVKNAGIKFDRLGFDWWYLQPNNGVWDSSHLKQQDSLVDFLVDRCDLTVLGILCYCAPWASSNTTLSDPSKAPPRRLFDSIWRPNPNGSGIEVNPDNYWAKYIEVVVNRYKDKVKYWQVWNGSQNRRDFFHYPDLQGAGREYESLFARVDTGRGMAILYTRMCEIAYRIIKELDPQAKIIGLSSAVDPGVRNWHSLLYQQGIKNWIDIISVEYYHDPAHASRFCYNHLYERLRTSLKSVMEENNDKEREVWFCEIGWATPPRLAGSGRIDSVIQANNLLEAFISGFGSYFQPEFRIDKMIWYDFRNDSIQRADSADTIEGSFGIVYRNLTPKPAYYAYQQMTRNLKGRMINWRWNDASGKYFVHEFEDPNTNRKFWVSWKQAGEGGGSQIIKFPVRTERVIIDTIDYNPVSPIPNPIPVGPAGYLSIPIDTTPLYIFEPSSESFCRPDLVVDSFKIIPDTPYVHINCTLKCWIRNIGNKETPSTPTEELRTLVALYQNGELKRTVVINGPIRPSQTTEVKIIFTPFQTTSRGVVVGTFPCLFKVACNPNKDFVEFDYDNNAKYKLVIVKGDYVALDFVKYPYPTFPNNQKKLIFSPDSNIIYFVYSDGEIIYLAFSKDKGNY